MNDKSLSRSFDEVASQWHYLMQHIYENCSFLYHKETENAEKTNMIAFRVQTHNVFDFVYVGFNWKSVHIFWVIILMDKLIPTSLSSSKDKKQSIRNPPILSNHNLGVNDIMLHIKLFISLHLKT